MQKKSVLFVGQAYYNAWFLSRSLRDLGWKSDLLQIDFNPQSQKHYWGEDFILPEDHTLRFEFYLNSLLTYDIFHFSNREAITFMNLYIAEEKSYKRVLRLVLFSFICFCSFASRINILFPFKVLQLMNLGHIDKSGSFKVNKPFCDKYFYRIIRGFPFRWDIYLLKLLGKKIVYSNSGCHDGVTPSSFNMATKVCETVCPWHETSVCTDKGAKNWGRFRNFIADYQILLGGNRVDYNKTKRAHEVPGFYCLDKDFWKPGIEIPRKYKLDIPDDVIKIYHSVGNYKSRTKNGINIKSSQIYFPLVEELKAEGYKVEIVFCHDVPNRDVRFVMAQCDIVVDMLTYGWFGANIREAMMLGLPTVCYLRPQWLKEVATEIPDYIKELPIVSATPQTIKDELLNLISDNDLRKNLGEKSREFAVKWHSKEAGASEIDRIYKNLF